MVVTAGDGRDFEEGDGTGIEDGGREVESEE